METIITKKMNKQSLTIYESFIYYFLLLLKGTLIREQQRLLLQEEINSSTPLIDVVFGKDLGFKGAACLVHSKGASYVVEIFATIDLSIKVGISEYKNSQLMSRNIIFREFTELDKALSFYQKIKTKERDWLKIV